MRFVYAHNLALSCEPLRIRGQLSRVHVGPLSAHTCTHKRTRTSKKVWGRETQGQVSKLLRFVQSYSGWGRKRQINKCASMGDDRSHPRMVGAPEVNDKQQHVQIRTQAQSTSSHPVRCTICNLGFGLPIPAKIISVRSKLHSVRFQLMRSIL